ncbi:hypothetical protein B7P43_G08259 [Cryptotermes secundus]|nr:hypothetical protein B7P43_G08259 [Cryptotermes secundus]
MVEGKASSSLYKFSVHKLESLDVTAGAISANSVNVTDIPSQLHSSKVDERILSTMENSNQLHGMSSELRNLKESFTCKDQRIDSAKQPFVNQSGNGVPINGSFLSSPVHQCKNTDLRRQKSRESKCMEGAICKNDDDSVESFLGFPDVPPAQDLCGNVGKDFVLTNLYSTSDSNQYSVINEDTEKCKINRNLSQSKSTNVSVILFDSWDSVQDRKLEPTSESKVCDQDQVLKSGMLSSDSQRLLYPYHTRRHCAQNSAVRNIKEGLCHINYSGSQRAQESSVLSTDTGLLCSSVSKNLVLQDSSADTDESQINKQDHTTQDSTVYDTDQNELLCSNISKSCILPESSVVNSDAGKQSISVKSIKKQKSLRRQSSRRLSHQVVPHHAHFKYDPKSPSFRAVYHISPSKTASNSRSELTVTLPEEIEEFKLLSISEEPLVCVTARDTVLQRCCQLAPISFSEAFPASYWSTCKKIGEGVYGEVFFAEEQERSVLKVIPVEGDAIVNGEPQKKFEEILSEIVIAMELSGLRNGTENRTCSFSEVKRCICVHGNYPEELIRLWEDYDNCKGSENDSPRMFKEDQLYIILVLAFGGCDLEAHFFSTVEQSHSVFIQTGCALAVAEQVLEFEHRDLHWGNVLVLPTAEKNVTFRICGKEYSIPTKGVQVTIIDFTLSRMAYDGCSIYNDLSKDPELFTSEGDYQFEVYRLMQKHTLNNWQHFKPYTNLLWLHYLLDKMCTMVNYNCKSSRSHKQGMKMLEKLQHIVLTYKSAQDFVLNELV